MLKNIIKTLFISTILLATLSLTSTGDEIENVDLAIEEPPYFIENVTVVGENLTIMKWQFDAIMKNYPCLQELERFQTLRNQKKFTVTLTPDDIWLLYLNLNATEEVSKETIAYDRLKYEGRTVEVTMWFNLPGDFGFTAGFASPTSVSD